MTDYKLWPATNGPNTASADDAATVGTEFKTATAGRYVKGIRYYRGTTAVVATTAAVWAHDSATLVSGSSITFDAPTGTGWQEKLLTAPYPELTPDTRYVVGAHFADNYTATPSYWTSGAGASGIGDADLSAPNPGGSAGGQGKYAYGETLSRPTENGNGTAFWVDVILSDSDGSGGGGDPDPEETGTVSAQLVGSAIGDAFAGLIDWENGDIVATLHTAAWTPNLTTLSRVSGLANEVPTGHGYVQGTGQEVDGRTSTFVPAASLTARANTTEYAVGDLVRPASSNGHVYRCMVAGTSGSSAPTWPTTTLTTVTDGEVTWLECGRGVAVLACDTIPFGGITGEALYLVLSDRTAALAADQPIIMVVQFETATSGTDQFDYVPPESGLIHFPVF
ncbi:DUF4082 domain-containing protein [Sphaerisporangium aureirubrum]|uniref:DUF4082 domain-containing protein n=1 Tax=Sphaerisporangium aureirubrum TaxID=1544736 RepID=A0ABW1NCB0_9ACTN